jgi:predicted nucleotidyltransferase
VSSEVVQARFQRALDTLVEKLKQDPYVLATILLGSMSHDVVWEKSDIDFCVVTQEVKIRYSSLNLTEESVNIHAYMLTRSQFKSLIEGSVGSSFMHSMLSKGTLLFTRDETIRELFDARMRFGGSDRQMQLLRYAAGAIPTLYKADKWLTVRGDLDYCALYVLSCVREIAAIETVLNGEIVGREVLQQALKFNPDLFNSIYTDLFRGNNTAESLRATIETINSYLLRHASHIFKPLLEYLAESGTLRSATEISDHFSKQMQITFIDSACEWLADENIIRKVSSPVRITEKSRVNVEETAYYYDPDVD